MMRIKLLMLLAFVSVLIVVFTLVKHEGNPNASSDSNETQLTTVNSDVLTLQDDKGETFDVSIDDIPVYKAYLESQDDIKIEIERTQYEMFDTSTDEHLILLKYSCGNKQCSTVLVKVNDDEITSIPLADGIFQDYKMSPAKDKLVVRYGFNEGGAVVRHLLIGIDLLDMKVIPFDSTQIGGCIYVHADLANRRLPMD